MTAPPLPVQRAEVTTPSGHRFVRASSVAAAMSVYGAGYRLRLVWGFAMPDGFHYPTDTPGGAR